MIGWEDSLGNDLHVLYNISSCTLNSTVLYRKDVQPVKLQSQNREREISKGLLIDIHHVRKKDR